jgi:hypothetical protein
MSTTRLFSVHNVFYVTVPLSTLLTTAAMLLPYWWTSETFQIGLWRARSVSSSWILVEPQIETHEGRQRIRRHSMPTNTISSIGRVLFLLQVFSFLSVLSADILGICWFILLLVRRSSPASLSSLLSLLIPTVLTYLCLSVMIVLVWQTTKDYSHLIHISYSFHMILATVVLHSLTLISLTVNLAKYRTTHHSVQPCDKIRLAFDEPVV